MKKLIFILLCFSMSIILGKCATIVGTDTPYYVTYKSNTVTKIVNVKKLYDKDTKEPIFSVTLNGKDDTYYIGDNFETTLEYSKEKCFKDKDNYMLFPTYVYYGYQSYLDDYHYFLTQYLIWKMFNYNTYYISDAEGNKITTYDIEADKLFQKIMLPSATPPAFYHEQRMEIWDTYQMKYYNNWIVYDDPIVKGLKIHTIDRTINIYNEEVGDYEIEFSKTYEQEIKCYTDGKAYYWSSTKGPSNVSKTLKYSVYGTMLHLNEVVDGVDNRLGDAKLLNSQYEIYLDGDLKLTTSALSFPVKSNSEYVIKDISQNEGFRKSADVLYVMSDQESTLDINKEVIRKQFSVEVKTPLEYQIYLKSNNELYATINKDTKELVLPYGIYELKENDLTLKEIEVLDEEAEEIIIEEIKEEVKPPVVDVPKDEVIENSKSDDLEDDLNDKLENNIEENNWEDNIEFEPLENLEEKDADLIIEEIAIPKTFDSIFQYLFLALLSSLFLGWLLKKGKFNYRD